MRRPGVHQQPPEPERPQGLADPDPFQDLVCWREILEGAELELDWVALSDWVQLARSSDLGYLEGCKIVYHLLKDSEDRDGSSSASGWLKKAVLDSNEALKNPQQFQGRPWVPQRRRRLLHLQAA